MLITMFTIMLFFITTILDVSVTKTDFNKLRREWSGVFGWGGNGKMWGMGERFNLWIFALLLFY